MSSTFFTFFELFLKFFFAPKMLYSAPCGRSTYGIMSIEYMSKEGEYTGKNALFPKNFLKNFFGFSKNF